MRAGLYLFAVLAACLVFVGCDREKSVEQEAVAAEPEKEQGVARVWQELPFEGFEWVELIESIDDAARLRTGLDPHDSALLLEGLAAGRPAHIDAGSWHHLVNSSLNALSHSEGIGTEDIVTVLVDLLEAEGSGKVLRLYALQHLGIHVPRLAGSQREEVAALVAAIAADESDEAAGTAMMVIGAWGGKWSGGEAREGFAEDAHVKNVVRTIADRDRAVDIRITAVHTAVDGNHDAALAPAREIATDRGEHTTLRKSALYLIGRLGGAEDVPLLEAAAKESTRIAQAAGPALQALRDRLDGRTQPTFIPYQ